MSKSIVISAPSGAGKTSIVNYLINEMTSLEFSVSACNRKKRKDEIDGKHYHFLETEDFKTKINSGLFLEWEEVYPNQFYGTLLSSVEEIWLRDKCVIFDVDVKGALNIKDKFQNNCLAIFIAPPNIETLQQRLLSRDTETKKNVKIRVAKAGKELELQHKFDHIVINDDFSTACKRGQRSCYKFFGKMTHIGLFFGSFNPFHIGHKAIGSHIAQHTDLDKVWFVVSPQNPKKEKKSLLNQHHRFQIIQREVEDNPFLDVSDIEFSLPLPSYTIDTLVNLSERYPEHKFSLIMGEDNIISLNKWKNYKQILNNYNIYVYPRAGEFEERLHENIKYIKDAPMFDISASFIRKSISAGKNVSSLIPEKAYKYIDEMNFYK